MGLFRIVFFTILLMFTHHPFKTLVDGNSFDPFMDSNLFSVSWLGPLDLNQEEIADLGDRHMVVTTNKKETYRCILPEALSEKSSDESSYTGPDVDEIMKPLFTQPHCSYRIESYWTYELCHGKSLKQYHETREQGAKPKVQEYFLGLGNSRTVSKDDSSTTLKVHSKGEGSLEGISSGEAGKQLPQEQEGQKSSLPVRDVEGVQLPYFEVVMDGGTRCDLTGQPRKARVLYICQPEGRGEIYEFKESSTCEYEVLVLSALLCKHPSYRPKTQPVSEIRCHAMVGSPLRPSELSRVEYEVRHLQTAPQRYKTTPDTEEQSEEPRQQKFFKKTPADEEAASIKTQEDPRSALSSLTDKQTMRNILTGSQCLQGGTGWWKHEVCIGRFAKQFHKDKQVDATIYLGHWNKEKHLQWLQDNPNKRPRAAQDRKVVSLLYSDGDLCDLTGKSRTCEVRLKCLQTMKNAPHAVILSLSEPSTCQYVLTVESALFCDVLKHADENGLIDIDA